jgi:hypothetical protein
MSPALRERAPHRSAGYIFKATRHQIAALQAAREMGLGKFSARR